MRSLALLLLLWPSLTLATPAGAQCSPFGPPCTSSRMLSTCVSAPQIGTTWTLGERDASACGLSSATPGTLFTIYGTCFGGGVPIGAPIACASCGGCFLSVLPSWGALVWTWPPRTTSLSIPSNPQLIGATFCIQDVCVNQAAACICMSQAQQVVIQ